MIDIILLTFMVFLFALGFWFGQKFGSMSSVWRGLRDTIDGWFR